MFFCNLIIEESGWLKWWSTHDSLHAERGCEKSGVADGEEDKRVEHW